MTQRTKPGPCIARFRGIFALSRSNQPKRTVTTDGLRAPRRSRGQPMAYPRSMATSSTVPVEEYLRTSYHPDMEYLDGQLVERHVGEYFHSRLQSLMAMVLGSRERERRFRAFIGQRVQVGNRPRYRIPD